jgi:hypothetical protein
MMGTCLVLASSHTQARTNAETLDLAVRNGLLRPSCTTSLASSNRSPSDQLRSQHLECVVRLQEELGSKQDAG